MSAGAKGRPGVSRCCALHTQGVLKRAVHTQEVLNRATVQELRAFWGGRGPASHASETTGPPPYRAAAITRPTPATAPTTAQSNQRCSISTKQTTTRVAAHGNQRCCIHTEQAATTVRSACFRFRKPSKNKRHSYTL